MCTGSLCVSFRNLFPCKRMNRVWPHAVTLLICAWLLGHSVSATKMRPAFLPVSYNPWADGKPSKIKSTAMATAPDGSIFAFSGSSTSGPSDDLFKLDVDTGEWHLIEPLGTVRPSARWGHAMSVAGTDIYVFGGSTESGMVCSWWIGRGQMEERAHAGWHRIRGGL